VRRAALPSALVRGAIVATAATPALANGRFPAAGQVVFDPGDPAHIVIRATYGILQTVDSGQSWQWICEGAIGYSGVEDPAMGVTGNGTILAGIFAGLVVSPDRGCSWAFEGGPLQDQYTIDVAVQQDDPLRALALTSTGSQSGFHVILAETADGGATWAQAGVAVDTEFLALTVEVAPSDPDRIYLSGLFGAGYDGAMARTSDRGQTWEILPFDLQGADSPYIGAIDPANPDRVYVRTDHPENDALYVSDDAGETWDKVAEAPGEMLGFALSPDGSQVAIGGPQLGLQVAATTDFTFADQGKQKIACLKWHDSGLYACASEFEDGFTLGRFVDAATGFTAVYHLADLEQLVCPAGTIIADTCPQEWPPVAETLGIGGSGGAGGAAPSSSGAGASQAGDGDGDDGCGVCSLGAVRPSRSGWAAAACVAGAALAAGLRRRPRRKR
jgi:photosystem II stability/assembly factor-like uncharacterized protein